MADYYRIINDDTNYALEPSSYLEQLKNEPDGEKKFKLLKKYFVEKITRGLYQNMDLLNTTQADFEKFKNMYLMIARDLFMNTLLAVDTLAPERGAHVPFYFGPGSAKTDPDNEYSICESYISSR